MGKLHFHAKKGQPWHMIRFKLDQDINVAIWPEVVSQHGPKERELADMVASAEIRNFIFRNGKVLIHISVSFDNPAFSLVEL
jgi:hypothetical protein